MASRPLRAGDFVTQKSPRLSHKLSRGLLVVLIASDYRSLS